MHLFEIPQSEDLTKVGMNPRRTPLSAEKQKYIARLLTKYGSDYEAMARDTKINAQQLTSVKLEKMASKFFSLDAKRRALPVPANVRMSRTVQS